MTHPSINKVTSAARMVRHERDDLAEAEDYLRDAIRQALAGGHSAAEVAEAAGLSRARIYQIRDGKR